MVSKHELSREETDPRLILSDLGKRFVERGLVVGSGGNLSMRVPGKESFYVTGTGTQLDRLGPDDFAEVTLDGAFDPDGIRPSSEYRVHLSSYRNRPDIDTCIHLHPQASVLLASLDLDTKFITIDHVYYLRKVVRIPWILSGTTEIADAVGVAISDCNVVILENHGCVVVADNPELAYSRALNLEEAAELTLRSHLIGIKPREVPDAYRSFLTERGL